MRPIPSFALATYTLGPQAAVSRVQSGTQPAEWKLAVLNHVVATFDEHPAGGPSMTSVSRDDLINEATAVLTAVYGSGGDYRQTVAEAVDALTYFAQDISADD